MFLKITYSKGYKYGQVVSSYREGKNVKQKVWWNLGRIDDPKNLEQIKAIVKKLNIHVKANLVDINEIEDAKVFNWGWQVYYRLWEQYGLDEILEEIKPKKLNFDFTKSCLLMVIEQLLSPKSKLGMYNHQNRYMGLADLDLNHLYRSLDILSEHKEDIEWRLFQRSKNLFNSKVDVVFYDCTTFYFESQNTDELRNFGFSKEGRINHVQVILGLLIDMEGRPVGYEIFEGSTFEGKTFSVVLEKLKNRFGIRQVVIVADRGLMSRVNLQAIEEHGYRYIIASRIKNLSESIKEKILNEEGYEWINDQMRCKEIKLEAFNVGDKEKVRRLIAIHSLSRAQKDRRDREKLVEKAYRLLERPSDADVGIKRGGRRYIKSEDKIIWKIDYEKIWEDSRYDGYYGIETNDSSFRIDEVIDYYHNLWRIEESFRCMKSTLEVRPIFHWTPRRIRGHFVMCFIAFLLERALEIELIRKGEKSSSEKIKEAINGMNYVELDVQGQKIYIKSKISNLGVKILKTLGMKLPSNIISSENTEDKDNQSIENI